MRIGFSLVFPHPPPCETTQLSGCNSELRSNRLHTGTRKNERMLKGRGQGAALACIALCLVVATIRLGTRGPNTELKARVGKSVGVHHAASHRATQSQLYTPAVKLPGPDTKGKVFDGWLHSSSTRKRVKGGDSDESEEDSDEGGETWYEREHLAEPPAGWHRPGHKKAAKGVTSKRQTKRKVPITHKMHKLTKDETPEAINRFRGNGADASPETIEEEVVDDKKPFGNGKKDRVNAASSPSSIAQKLHKEHRISMNINM